MGKIEVAPGGGAKDMLREASNMEIGATLRAIAAGASSYPAYVVLEAAERLEREREAEVRLSGQSSAARLLGVAEGQEFTFCGKIAYRVKRGILQQYGERTGWVACEQSFNSIVLELDSVKK